MTTAAADRPLPRADECERGILASALLDPRTIDETACIVAADDFFDRAKGKLFSAIVDLREAKFPVNDLRALSQELPRFGASTHSLTDLRSALEDGFAHNARHYAIEIRKASLLRQQIAAACQVIERCHAAKADPSDVAGWVDVTFAAMGEQQHNHSRHVGEIAGEVLERIDKGGPRPGASWSIHSIDDAFGQMANGRLIVLAALAGRGKTAMAGQIAIHNAQRGRDVLFASLEMTEQELTQRWLCSEAGVDSRDVDAGRVTSEDRGLLSAARQELNELPIHIFDTHGATTRVLRAEARMRQKTTGLDLLIVDYLGKVHPLPEDARLDQRLKTGRVSWAMAELAKELDIPVILLHQLSREASKVKPTIHHLAESADVERDAGVVAMLHDAGKGKYEFVIGKNRYGAKGTLPIVFDGASTRFKEPEDF